MKISSLFDLITESRDLLDFFEEVDTRDQLVSRLERLKRAAPDELLDCVVGLREAVSRALGDTLEMSAVLDDPEEDDPTVDAELDRIASEVEEENGEKADPAEPPPDENEKNEVHPPG